MWSSVTTIILNFLVPSNNCVQLQKMSLIVSLFCLLSASKLQHIISFRDCLLHQCTVRMTNSPQREGGGKVPEHRVSTSIHQLSDVSSCEQVYQRPGKRNFETSLYCYNYRGSNQRPLRVGVSHNPFFLKGQKTKSFV